MSSAEWTKGAANADGRVNIWSLNGYGEPVITGSMYSEDEVRTLQLAVHDYCESNDVTVSQLCGGADHTVHNKRIRGAWQVIAQCLPHRTVLSVYRKALRRFHTHTRGKWSEDEIRSLLRLVELHGHKWKSIQDKLGRSATDCRLKFFDLTDGCKRGKWSLDEVEALLKAARSALNVPRDDMDVREINQWTLDHNTKLPFTSLCHQVKRRRQDCYFKWKQLTKRSNKKAAELGLEGVPMARETIKFNVRTEYMQWKAEQDPQFREQYAEQFLLPQLRGEDDGSARNGNREREHDMQLLDSIIKSNANRPSEVNWRSIKYSGEGDARDRWDGLVEDYARDEDLDLPLCKLAKVVKDLYGTKRARKQTKKRKRDDSPTEEEEIAEEKEIAGQSMSTIRATIGKIMADQSLENLTVKKIRKKLEKELGIDLLPHKAAIKDTIKDML